MKYKVIFALEAYQKLRAYVKIADDEISGLGRVFKYDEDREIYVSDIVLLEQESGVCSTSLSSDGVAKFMDEVMKRGDDPSEYKCWFHSHAHMDCFFSQTDVDTIESLDTEQDKENWWLSVVANKAGRMLLRIDVFRPIRVTIKDVDFDVDLDDKKLEKKLKKEIKKKTNKEVHFMDKGAVWDFKQQKWVIEKKHKKKFKKKFKKKLRRRDYFNG